MRVINLYKCASCPYIREKKKDVNNHIRTTHSQDMPQNRFDREDAEMEQIGDDHSQKAKDHMHVLRKDGFPLCKECFLAPCFFADLPNRHQSWIQKIPIVARRRDFRKNKDKRKKLYYRVWGSFYNIGAFGLKEYREKKRRSLGSLGPAERRRARKVREILPECALQKIRYSSPDQELSLDVVEEKTGAGIKNANDHRELYLGSLFDGTPKGLRLSWTAPAQVCATIRPDRCSGGSTPPTPTSRPTPSMSLATKSTSAKFNAVVKSIMG